MGEEAVRARQPDGDVAPDRFDDPAWCFCEVKVKVKVKGFTTNKHEKGRMGTNGIVKRVALGLGSRGPF